MQQVIKEVYFKEDDVYSFDKDGVVNGMISPSCGVIGCTGPDQQIVNIINSDNEVIGYKVIYEEGLFQKTLRMQAFIKIVEEYKSKISNEDLIILKDFICCIQNQTPFMVNGERKILYIGDNFDVICKNILLINYTMITSGMGLSCLNNLNNLILCYSNDIEKISGILKLLLSTDKNIYNILYIFG